MRIIAGNYRGKKLFSPQNEGVRPTSDRTREALFNVLNSRLDLPWNAYRFLDVFAGTGACGFEALSRGVEKVCFIDRTPLTVRKNATLFPKEMPRIKVIAADAAKLPAANEKYNLFFMDPPYHQGLVVPALNSLVAQGWLSTDAVGIAEVEKSEQPEIPEIFKVTDERIYGLAKILFLSYQG